MRESSDWPFADPPNVACFTTWRVLDGIEPIVYVSHDAEDGAWQFLPESGAIEELAAVVSLKNICSRDPSVRLLADLPLGWYASRSGVRDEWIRSPHQTAELRGSTEVAVPLLDEGVNVWCMVSATHVSGDIYQISPEEQPGETEIWQFHPGDLVHCVRKKLSGGEVLVAVRRQEINSNRGGESPVE
jgi:hypothetical protein